MTNNLRKGMTRDEVFRLMGEPTDTGRGTRKYPMLVVYRFGRIECAFEYGKDGGLVYVMDVGESGEDHKFILSGHEESK